MYDVNNYDLKDTGIASLMEAIVCPKKKHQFWFRVKEKVHVGRK